MPAVSTIPPQPLHDTDGKVFAYFVPADQFDKLQAEMDELREQVMSLTRQRDHYAEQLKQSLLTFVPESPTEDDFRVAQSRPADLSALIGELEKK